MDTEWLQSLLLRGLDIRQVLELTRQAREELHSGGVPRLLPSQIIADHRTLIRRGVDPRSKVRIQPDLPEWTHRRNRHPLVPMMPDIARRLGVGSGSERMLVLIDRDGFVLEREGSPMAKRLADDFGLICGVNWAGDEPGTNAVRSSVHQRGPVLMVGHQHLRLDQCTVACASTPVSDSNGRLVGFLDLVCPAETVNVDMLRLTNEVALSLRPTIDRKHHERLDRLRQEASNLKLRRHSAGMLVIDWDGWVAVTYGGDFGHRVDVPAGGFSLGRNELSELGSVVLEPVWGGWLMRASDTGEPTPDFDVILDLRQNNPSRDRAGWIQVIGPTVSWEPRKLSLKQAEILLLLALSERDGLTQGQLEQALYPVPPGQSTARSACQRVREVFRAVLVSDPYRFADRVRVTVRYPSNKIDLLRGSVAPGIIQLRDRFA